MHEVGELAGHRLGRHAGLAVVVVGQPAGGGHRHAVAVPNPKI